MRFDQLTRRVLLTGFAVTMMAGCLGASADFPNPAVDIKDATGKQTIVLSAGCFWCTEIVFQHINGVEKVVSGYSGGDANTAHYEMVSTGKTGHAESVEVTYDPKKISYGQILKVFFSVAHDPTQLNRQGPDTGPQYRSAIFYTTPDQKRVAEAYIKQLDAAKYYPAPIVTQINQLTKFYPAEEHHQNYCNRNPGSGYVQQVALPKVDKAKKYVPELYKK